MINGRPSSLRATRVLLVVVLVVVLALPSAWAGSRARRVILMIGDGMGPAQVGLVLDYVRFVRAGQAHMERLIDYGYTGYTTTHPLGALVTDSAASGSALATGRVTKNGIVSWSEEEGDVETVAERAHAAGKAVGLVTTTRLTHATPAVFAAHCRSRDMEDEIARQELIGSRFEVLLGGGSRHFETLLDTAAMLGYTVVRTAAELEQVDTRRSERLLGVFSRSHMSYEIDRGATDEPSLAQMTAAALERLGRDPDGFFLMVEGGRIDHACHDNDPGTLLHGLLAFDEAVGVALSYAERHRGTLLLVTADHETGGLAFTTTQQGEGYGGAYGDPEHLALLARQTASFASLHGRVGERPSAEVIREVLLDLCGEDIGMEAAARASRLGPTPFFSATTENILGQAVGPSVHVSWASSDHSSTPLFIFGMGPGAERFRGIHHVSEVGRLLFQVTDFSEPGRLHPLGGSRGGRGWKVGRAEKAD
jgi:alkaline phosphatase